MNATADPVAEDAAEHRETLLVSWLARCARGDAEGLENLYEALSPQLFGLLLRILQQNDLAEDALQETFVNVWRKASGYRADRGKVTTWIFTIARNRAFDILRRRRRESTVDPENVIELSDADSAVQEEDSELPRSLAEYRRLQQCLHTLSEQQRSSVVMAYFRGLTQEEIANSFGAPLGTVRSWVRRALFSLKRCLEG